MNVGACKCCRGIGTWYGWRIDIIAHALAWALAIIRSSMWRARSVFHSSSENSHRRGTLASSHVLLEICVLLLTPLTFPTVVWTGLLGAILGSSQHDTVNLSSGDIRVHRGSLD